VSVRIGLLGASKISRGAVIGPARELDGVEVTRVAARDPARARAFADEHGIGGIESDYAALVESDAVDLVYNGLPPNGHAEWSIRALVAGKHVLCEKPFAMNAAEVETMLEATEASDAFLVEAFHHRYHPLWHRIVELLAERVVGDIREVEAHFWTPIPWRAGELRYDPALGGGAMMDLGCYPVHWSRTVVGTEPKVASASATWHDSGVDLSMQARLEFPGGETAKVFCSMDEQALDGSESALVVSGSKGRMTVVNPLAPHGGHTLTIETAEGSHSEEVPGQSTYYHQLEWMLDVIAGRKAPLTGGDDGFANMRVLDAAYALARSA
jgi:predicted dehydrogenase